MTTQENRPSELSLLQIVALIEDHALAIKSECESLPMLNEMRDCVLQIIILNARAGIISERIQAANAAAVGTLRSIAQAEQGADAEDLRLAATLGLKQIEQFN